MVWKDGKHLLYNGNRPICEKSGQKSMCRKFIWVSKDWPGRLYNALILLYFFFFNIITKCMCELKKKFQPHRYYTVRGKKFFLSYIFWVEFIYSIKNWVWQDILVSEVISAKLCRIVKNRPLRTVLDASHQILPNLFIFETWQKLKALGWCLFQTDNTARNLFMRKISRKIWVYS